MILLWLLYLHFLGDFPLQGAYLAENKGKNDYLLFAHSFIWAGTVSLGLYYFGMFSYLNFAFLLIGHFLLDRLKARKVGVNEQLTFVLDQTGHFIQLLAVTYL